MTIAPEQRRWLILAVIFAAFVLNYVDRQIVSVLKPQLQAEFGVGERGYAVLVNVFLACYATSYVVAGWLVDRHGAGRVLMLGIGAWSAACMAAAAAGSFLHLAVCRGLLGCAEPLAFPAQLRVVATWFPAHLRGTANSICAAGSTIGAIIAAPVVAGLTVQFGWRAAFVVPGALGLAVAAWWWLVYRDPPAAGDGATTRGGGSLSWPKLLRSRSLQGLLVARFVSDPVWYFCLFWLPGYLQKESGLTLEQIGLYGWIPFLVADVGGVASSMVSDLLVRRGMNSLTARKATLAAVAAVAPVCMLTTRFDHPAATLAIFSLVGAVCLTWLFGLGVVVAETFPAGNVGSAWGIAGACGTLGAIAFNAFVGDVLESYGPDRIFAVMAVLHPVAATILWLTVRPTRTAPM